MAEEDHLVVIVTHLVVIITLQKVNYPTEEVVMGVLVALLVIALPSVLVVGQIIVLGLVEGLTVLHQVVIKSIDNQ